MRHYCRHGADHGRPRGLGGRNRHRDRHRLVRRERRGQECRRRARHAGDQRGGAPGVRASPAAPGRRRRRPERASRASVPAPASGRLPASPSRSPRRGRGDRPGGVGASRPRVGRPARPASVHAYTLTGGHVTLEVTPSSVQLVTAVPDAGYAVTDLVGHGLAARRLQLRAAGVVPDRQLVRARADDHGHELSLEKAGRVRGQALCRKSRRPGGPCPQRALPQ